MKLRELIEALQGELEGAGIDSEGVMASLAFSARKDRDGTIHCDFVDAGAMSKPRPEEIHRLDLPVAGEGPSGGSTVEVPEPAAKDPAPPKLNIPPALPPKRRALE